MARSLATYGGKPQVKIPPITTDVDPTFFPATNALFKQATSRLLPKLNSIQGLNLKESCCAQCGDPARFAHRTGKILRFYCKTHHPFHKS